MVAAGRRPVESVRAYLVTIVTRLCIDQLDSSRVQRVSYAGPWLPEPVAVDDTRAVEQADSLSLAFLVLLEELTPLERAAYLLHDIFGYSFDEVARSSAAPRRLPSAGRSGSQAHRGASPALRCRPPPWPRTHGPFLVACATGDLSGLLAMLSDDVVVWTDGGGKVRAAMRPVIGPHRSSRFSSTWPRRSRRAWAAVLTGSRRPCSSRTGTWSLRWCWTSSRARSWGSASSPIPTSSDV